MINTLLWGMVRVKLSLFFILLFVNAIFLGATGQALITGENQTIQQLKSGTESSITITDVLTGGLRIISNILTLLTMTLTKSLETLTQVLFGFDNPSSNFYNTLLLIMSIFDWVINAVIVIYLYSLYRGNRVA